jgi:hypothetical protein
LTERQGINPCAGEGEDKMAINFKILLSCSASIMLLASQNAVAQSASAPAQEAEDAGLDDIVVTEPAVVRQTCRSRPSP